MKKIIIRNKPTGIFDEQGKEIIVGDVLVEENGK